MVLNLETVWCFTTYAAIVINYRGVAICGSLASHGDQQMHSDVVVSDVFD